MCSTQEYVDAFLSLDVDVFAGAVGSSTLKSPSDMKDLCVKLHIHVMSPSWVLDSVVNYKLQPFDAKYE